MENRKLSVIIPAFNMERYLECCIKNIDNNLLRLMCV